MLLCSLLFLSLSYHIFCPLVSWHFHFLFLCSCYACQTAETWGVTDHISRNLFLILGLSKLERETQVQPKYYLFRFSKQSMRGKASIHLSFCLTNGAVVPKRRYWPKTRLPKWLCSFRAGMRSTTYNLFPLQPTLLSTPKCYPVRRQLNLTQRRQPNHSC